MEIEQEVKNAELEYKTKAMCSSKLTKLRESNSVFSREKVAVVPALLKHKKLYLLVYGTKINNKTMVYIKMLVHARSKFVVLPSNLLIKKREVEK